MDEKVQTTLGVRAAIGGFTFLAVLIVFVIGVYGYHKYLAYQDAKELERLTEKHIAVQFPEAEMLQLKADTEIFGERQAHVIFQDEPQIIYSYLGSPPGVRQIKPNPPAHERDEYKHLE